MSQKKYLKVFFVNFLLMMVCSYGLSFAADNHGNTNYIPNTASTSSYGRLLASQCYQCHGPEGRSRGEIDSISGKSASELYHEMMEMKQENKIEIMHLQIKTYTDEEIQQIANYLSTLRR